MTTKWFAQLKVGDKVALKTCRSVSREDEYYSAVVIKVTKAQVEIDFHNLRFRLSDGKSVNKPSGTFDPRDEIVEPTTEIITEINGRILRNRMRVHFETLIKNSKSLSHSALREILEVTKPIYESLRENKS